MGRCDAIGRCQIFALSQLEAAANDRTLWRQKIVEAKAQLGL
jgi:hypothetical protein